MSHGCEVLELFTRDTIVSNSCQMKVNTIKSRQNTRREVKQMKSANQMKPRQRNKVRGKSVNTEIFISVTI